MNKKYFTDKLSDETLIKLIDRTYNYEKNIKRGSIKGNLLKAIPAAAAIILVIGLVNMLPVILNNMEVSPGSITETPTAANNAGSTIKIGNLSITTPKGQDPIENDDGTITLPGGGIYERLDGDKVTVSTGMVLNKDGTIDMELTANKGKKITIEDSNGDIIIIDGTGHITINGKSISSIVTETVESVLQSFQSFQSIQSIDSTESIERKLGNYDDLRSKPSYTYDELIKEIYDEALLVEKTYTNISSVSLDITADNVVVSKGGDSVKIKYYEWTKDEYKLSESDGKLTLKYMVNDRYYKDAKNTSMTDDWVNAVLRKSKREVNARTIEITIPENVTLESLFIDGVSGNIGISDCSIKKISADTTSGNISIKNCINGESYYADTTSGNVYVSKCNDARKITVDTTSGNVNITECSNIQTVIADVTSGNITVRDCDITAFAANGKTYYETKNYTYKAPSR